MSLSDGDIAFAVDLFAELGALTTRKMFGGMCLYHDGTVFALQSKDGRLYLKTKDPVGLLGNQADQFHNMPYYAIPEDMLDDPDAAVQAARTALMALV
jgi:DNA transformation protein